MGNHDPAYVDELSDAGQKFIPPHVCHPKTSPWFDLRVFYIRVSNCSIEKTPPAYLTLNHIPLSPDTILKVNGRRSSIYADQVSSSLRRDRIDKSSEEATFVSTESISMTGSVRFEVYDKDLLLLTGVLELRNSNGFAWETKKHSNKWSMNCQTAKSANTSFLKSMNNLKADLNIPTVEVYVAGWFSGSPIILAKSLQLGVLKKNRRMFPLGSIPEDETTEVKKEEPREDALQTSEHPPFKEESDSENEYCDIYARHEYSETEDELSWFNAGVRVGVGIGLGICIGTGIGVGLLVRMYQATNRNFKRRII
ncbi:uncharacterized protein At1g01500-like [Zingiber officinale]|nr:uncharacterized protein At1g01500-like [Zingiber officinale]XP_042394226.1 uncharacterized protein At1g01500-like [Zingiber officinale]XP_042394227.1 uncharacterized protein At1g01500-like [Zingiber officinale]